LLYTASIHFKHLATTLGETFPLSELTHAALQRHIDRRAKQGIAPVTIKKEISTLRAAWNWGRRNELVDSEWPGRGLVYHKGSEEPPFQTREEIERQISAGGLTREQKKELWQALYLTKPEMEETLEIVHGNAAHRWIYPMAATAAFTGARRSELIRMRVSDFDFAANVVVVREKKRVRGKRTTRRVPLTKTLGMVLKDYLKTHPGGPYLFCHAGPGSGASAGARIRGSPVFGVVPLPLSGVRAAISPPG